MRFTEERRPARQELRGMQGALGMFWDSGQPWGHAKHRAELLKAQEQSCENRQSEDSIGSR